MRFVCHGSSVRDNPIFNYPSKPPKLRRDPLGSANRDLFDCGNVTTSCHLHPVFEALETNKAGRSLMAGLVIHRANPDFGDTDAYFAMAMRSIRHLAASIFKNRETI